MDTYMGEISTPTIAVPVIGVLLCGLIVFAFGFKSSSSIPEVDFSQYDLSTRKKKPKLTAKGKNGTVAKSSAAVQTTTTSGKAKQESKAASPKASKKAESTKKAEPQSPKPVVEKTKKKTEPVKSEPSKKKTDEKKKGEASAPQQQTKKGEQQQQQAKKGEQQQAKKGAAKQEATPKGKKSGAAKAAAVKVVEPVIVQEEDDGEWIQQNQRKKKERREVPASKPNKTDAPGSPAKGKRGAKKSASPGANQPETEGEVGAGEFKKPEAPVRLPRPIVVVQDDDWLPAPISEDPTEYASKDSRNRKASRTSESEEVSVIPPPKKKSAPKPVKSDVEAPAETKAKKATNAATESAPSPKKEVGEKKAETKAAEPAPEEAKSNVAFDELGDAWQETAAQKKKKSKARRD